MTRTIFLTLLVVLLMSVFVIPNASALGGATTTRVSVDGANMQGNGTSSTAFINATGSHIAFTSAASNWFPGDNNSTLDVFLKHRESSLLEYVSFTAAGGQPNGPSLNPSVSADARFVVFDSLATNIVPGDDNSGADVFLRDRLNGTTTRISQDPITGNGWYAFSSQSQISDDGRWVVFTTLFDFAPNDDNGFTDIYLWDRLSGSFTLISQYQGVPGDGDSEYADVSADGRYIVFHTRAQNFPGNHNGYDPDVYLVDRVTGVMERISLTGGTGSNSSFYPRVSNDGRYVTFQSNSSSLIPGDTNGLSDVFLVDRDMDTTVRLSEGANGEQTSHVSYNPEISGDGRYIAYESLSGVLVAGDNNDHYDIFLYDRITDSTTRVSPSSTGEEGNGDSERPSLPDFATSVVFQSRATNLVPADSNGVTDVYAHGDTYVPITPTPSQTASPTMTPTTTTSPTMTPTATVPNPATFTPTATASATLTPRATGTIAPSTPTATVPVSLTPTASPTGTVAVTITATATVPPGTDLQTLYLPLVTTAEE